MYYLRTKAAVDAIKFTLNNDKKTEPIVQTAPKEQLEVVQVAEPVITNAMTAEEYRAMIEMARNAGPEDCEMCGS